jgi:hypothetical protein
VLAVLGEGDTLGEGEKMMRVAIVYHSSYGHTERQAQAVRLGVEGVDGVEALLLSSMRRRIAGQSLVHRKRSSSARRHMSAVFRRGSRPLPKQVRMPS